MTVRSRPPAPEKIKRLETIRFLTPFLNFRLFSCFPMTEKNLLKFIIQLDRPALIVFLSHMIQSKRFPGFGQLDSM